MNCIFPNEDAMKTFTIYGLTAILLISLIIGAFAQNADPAHSAFMQQMQRDGQRRMMNSMWNGESTNLIVVEMLDQDDIREGLGVSQEQYQKIRDMVRGPALEDDPRIKSFQDERDQLMSEHGSPFAEDASKELKEKFLEFHGRLLMTMQEILINTVNENLTPNQLKKINEFQIAAMSEFPIPFPSMFEALDLSDDQKKQLGNIRKEMEPEWEKFVDKLVDGQMKFQEKIEEALKGRLEGITDPEERERVRKNIVDNVRKASPEMQTMMNEMMASGKELADKLKIQMFDVLTDAQWARMVDLIDNPPEYVKKAIAQMRKQMGTDDPQARSRQPGSGYVPAPGAWQPGQGIPEGYRIERNKRSGFPRGE